MDNLKNILLKKLKDTRLLAHTQFIIVYGSVSRGEQNTLSDIDICVSLDLPPLQRLKARMKLLSVLPEKYDVHIFEDAPLYLQKSILSGKIIYCKNKEELINRALAVIDEYEDFEPVYEHYINQRKSTVNA